MKFIRGALVVMLLISVSILAYEIVIFSQNNFDRKECILKYPHQRGAQQECISKFMPVR